MSSEAQKDMTNAEREIAQILRSLQATATLCANTFTTSRVSVDYRVAFSTGVALPWRMLEIHFRLPCSDKRYTRCAGCTASAPPKD